jgi:radical SAM protein with 4Fe4S-binding SPASM domain
VPNSLSLVDRAIFFIENEIWNFQFGITVDRLNKDFYFSKDDINKLKKEYTQLYHIGKEFVRKGLFGLIKENIWGRFTNYYGIFLGKSAILTMIPCGAGWETISVATNGRVHACPCLHEGKEFEIGAIGGKFDYQKMEEIYTTADINSSACYNCWARHLCGGGCLAYYKTDDIEMQVINNDKYCSKDNRKKNLQPDENVCDLIRHIAYLAISSFVEISEYQAVRQ